MIQVASNYEGGAAPPLTSTSQNLRALAAAFESAQAQRLRTGDQIRALVRSQGQAPFRASRGSMDADALLAQIRAGASPAVIAPLGETYRRQWVDERELLRLMSDLLATHPAWPWLGRVRGVGPSLAARLLARLDIDRAPTPSSFWSYCGLATVAADVYRCDACGFELSIPAGRPVRAAHRAPGNGQSCTGALARVGEGPRRVAQPRPGRGESAPYDREAKKLCYLIGVSFVRQGDSYKRYYQEQRARLDGTKEDWIPRRRHLTALRMTEKLFLAHLWLVWREQLGLPVTAPYADERDDAVPSPRPWSMVSA